MSAVDLVKVHPATQQQETSDLRPDAAGVIYEDAAGVAAAFLTARQQQLDLDLIHRVLGKYSSNRGGTVHIYEDFCVNGTAGVTVDNPGYEKTYSRSEFTANGKLHYYGHTGEFDGRTIRWSNGSVYTKKVEMTKHHVGTKTSCCTINLAKMGFTCLMTVVVLGPLCGGAGYYIKEETPFLDPPPPTPSEREIANPKCTYMTDSTCNLTDSNIPQSVSEAYCPYFHNRKPRAQPQLPNCTMYRTSSCCLAEEIEQMFTGVQPLIYASPQCQYYQRTLMCFICSPAQSIFYKNESLNVCTEYCDRYYDACKDAYVGFNKIGDLYDSGTAFCSELQYSVTNTDCFTQNSAAKSKMSFAAMLLPLLGFLALQ